MPFYVKSSVGDNFYHTGEFSRDVPPDPYLTTKIEEAASWDTREAAQSWADQFGGEIVEIKQDMKTDPEKFNDYMLAKDALNKLADCAAFGENSVTLTRDEILALFSQKVIDLDANQGMIK
jgi:hypothetical protein